MNVERSVLSAEAADNTVVSFNSNKSNLHSKSSIDLNNLINSPTNVEAHFDLNPAEKLRGPVVINIQGRNETRHQRSNKQNPGNPDLGHNERARRRDKGNKSKKGKVTNKGGGSQGEVKKGKKPILQTEYEFLPSMINEVAAVDLPTPYARVKVQGREIFAKGLIDTGNSCKNSLISEDFFNLCGGEFLHSQQVRLNTAAEGEGLPVLGQARPFKIYLEGIKKPITINR